MDPRVSKGEGKDPVARVGIASVASAAWIGSAIDWYDFFLASFTAALIWPGLYFKFLSGPIALVISTLSTVVIGYIARPIGSIVFGHFGDKMGRKVSLVVNLILAGISMFGVAFLPTYAAIGLYAPALLILLRFVFGLSLGGEYGGAQSLITEFLGESRWRGFWNSVIASALPTGIVLSSIGYLLTLKFVGSSALAVNGWRYPFIAGGAAIVVGIVLRYYIAETPLFQGIKSKGKVERVPIAAMFKEVRWLLMPLCLLNTAGLAITLLAGNGPYPIALMRVSGLTFTEILYAIALGYVVATGYSILSGFISDLIGRKRMFIIGSVIAGAGVYPALLLLHTGHFPYAVAGQALGTLIFLGTTPILGAWYQEVFPTRYRYTGSGFCFNVSSLVGTLLASLAGGYGITVSHGVANALPYLTAVGISGALISLASAIAVPETRGSRLKE